jgi:uncharacterized membrane protein
MTYLILGLAIFLGIHGVSIVAPAARDRWVAALGANAWRGIYSLISIVGFVLLIYGYGLARQAPVMLYASPQWLRHVALLLMLPVFPLLFAAYLPGRIKTAMKHPMLVAVKAWALAHLLAFLVWAVVDRISLKRRVARVVPAAAPSRWNDAIAVVGGLAVYTLTLFWLHRVLIGVPVV